MLAIAVTLTIRYRLLWHDMAWYSIALAHSQQLSALSSVACLNHSTVNFLRIHYLYFFDLSHWPPYSTSSYSYLDFQGTTLVLSPTPHHVTPNSLKYIYSYLF